MLKNLASRIKDLKQKHEAVILVHSYQRPEVQELGDFIGDSLGLCIAASKTDAKLIVFCGVHFMAESAKLLNPKKTVLLPEKEAGCPMADMASAERLTSMKKEHPGAIVVSYVNTTAAVKAESDICCTSSNAVKVIESIPPDKKIIFVPDRHLGRYIVEKTGREMILWPGFCPVHQRILPQNIMEKKRHYPDAVVVVHPESSKDVIEQADVVGSTEFIYKYCINSKERVFIIGTEEGILYRLRKANPEKTFVPASDLTVCKNMKLTTLESVFYSMDRMEHVIEIDPEIAERAITPLQRMLQIR
ncbi:MAG: quinolinate synthase NadA [Spirochaetota bacterium]